MQRMRSKSKIAIEWKADLEICLYLENRSLEFHENTFGNK